MRSSRYIGPYWCPQHHATTAGPCLRCNTVTLHLGEVAMTETQTPYIPAKVAPLEREKAGLERMLEQNTQEGKEIRAKLEQVQNKIAETMGEATGE